MWSWYSSVLFCFVFCPRCSVTLWANADESSQAVIMKHQNAPKRHLKNKWHTHGKRIRHLDPSGNSPRPSTAKLDNELVNRQKPKLKRLQKAYTKAATVTSKDGDLSQIKGKATSTPFLHFHTNGGTEVETGSDSEDSQDWRSYAKSVLQNGLERGAGEGNSVSNQLEEEDRIEYHAQYDDSHNHTVLVLKQGQVKINKIKMSCFNRMLFIVMPRWGQKHFFLSKSSY